MNLTMHWSWVTCINEVRQLVIGCNLLLVRFWDSFEVLIYSNSRKFKSCTTWNNRVLLKHIVSELVLKWWHYYASVVKPRNWEHLRFFRHPLIVVDIKPSNNKYSRNSKNCLKSAFITIMIILAVFSRRLFRRNSRFLHWLVFSST